MFTEGKAIKSAIKSSLSAQIAVCRVFSVEHKRGFNCLPVCKLVYANERSFYPNCAQAACSAGPAAARKSVAEWTNSKVWARPPEHAAAPTHHPAALNSVGDGAGARVLALPVCVCWVRINQATILAIILRPICLGRRAGVHFAGQFNARSRIRAL